MNIINSENKGDVALFLVCRGEREQERVLKRMYGQFNKYFLEK